MLTLVATYTILAIVATLANICAQEIALRAYSGQYHIMLSVIAGTAVGLLVKYILDKKYIFRFRAKNMAHDGYVFLLYLLMGLVTTAIFWGLEFAFHFLFSSKEMRYLGGIIGLAIGYTIKYHLDKNYVFRERPA